MMGGAEKCTRSSVCLDESTTVCSAPCMAREPSIASFLPMCLGRMVKLCFKRRCSNILLSLMHDLLVCCLY